MNSPVDLGMMVIGFVKRTKKIISQEVGFVNGGDVKKLYKLSEFEMCRKEMEEGREGFREFGTMASSMSRDDVEENEECEKEEERLKL